MTDAEEHLVLHRLATHKRRLAGEEFILGDAASHEIGLPPTVIGMIESISFTPIDRRAVHIEMVVVPEPRTCPEYVVHLSQPDMDDSLSDPDVTRCCGKSRALGEIPAVDRMTIYPPFVTCKMWNPRKP